jgi:lipopolysaccharide/colanic/teichoic acid biosynthesis glycosyltransferase
MFKFARKLNRSRKTAPQADSLHSLERMRAILDRERMRSDRGSSMFALLTFTFSEPCSNEQFESVGQVLKQRLRVTDDAGILGPNCVGAVLPETSVVGAWKLADDVCDLLPGGIPRPECKVYVHPADRDPAAREPGEQIEAQDATTADNATEELETVDASGAAPQSVEDDQSVEIGPPVGLDQSSGVAVAEAPVASAVVLQQHPRSGEAMKLLFVQAMPWWKRAIDVVGSAMALVVFSPVLLLAAIAIKLSSSGPVFFAQRRHGLGGLPFTIYKLRTMCVDAEAQKAALRALSEQDGPAFKLKKDPRVTRVGSFLRKTSIDELPQLFNVLLGDMSLVGPRPLPCGESEGCVPWQQRRLDVTPGLTCIWQVRGRSKVTFDEWVRMDVQYIRSRSLVTDVGLIAQTLPAVVLRKGAC